MGINTNILFKNNLVYSCYMGNVIGSTLYPRYGSMNLAIINNIPLYDGVIGKCMRFDGTMRLDGNTSLYTTVNNTFTVNIAFRTGEGTGSSMMLCGNFGTGGGWGVYLHDGYVHVELKAQGGADIYYTDSNSRYNDNRWHISTCKITTNTTSNSGNSALIYIDGVLVAQTETRVSGVYACSNNFVVGARDVSVSRLYYIGYINFIDIYNIGLTEKEISLIYNQKRR